MGRERLKPKLLTQIFKLASYSAEHRRNRRKQKVNTSSHPAKNPTGTLPRFRHKPG
jgi:hypothetical protein